MHFRFAEIIVDTSVCTGVSSSPPDCCAATGLRLLPGYKKISHGYGNRFAFPPCGNYCSHQCLHWCQQQSTGLLHCDRFDSLLCVKKEDPHKGDLLFWSRVRESNPPSRLGKPLYYRYTNPASMGIIAEGFCRSKGKIGNFRKFLFLFMPCS